MPRIALSFLLFLASLMIISSARAEEAKAGSLGKPIRLAKTQKRDLNAIVKEFPLRLGRSISYRINPQFKVGIQPGKTTRFSMTMTF